MSLLNKLELLANPTPTFEDPQDVDFDSARPRLVHFEDELETEILPGQSSLRKINAVELSQTDERYIGQKTTRKSLSAFEKQHDDESYSESSNDSNVESDSDDQSSNSDLEDQDVSEQDASGSSEDSNENDEDDDTEGDNNDLMDDMSGNEDTLRTFSHLNLEENSEKGVAVKSQLKLWDSLLECRIKLQKVLLAANQLPQFDVWNDFWKSDADSTNTPQIKSSQRVTKSLLDSFVQLHSLLMSSNSELNQLVNVKQSDMDAENEDYEGVDEDEIKVEKPQIGLKRKLKMAEYPNYLKKIHLDFEAPRNSIIQKWDDKTKVSAGRLKKSFSGFDQSALQQIQQILSDKSRLVNRTQLKRSTYQILGKKIAEADKEDNVSYHETVLKQDSHLKDYDEEIFDDNDFYHQLLRELIEHKTTDISDSNALGRQWLEIQKLRSKMKKKVDTRASKGRKLRYEVHSKLTSFMAPVQQSNMPEESRKELFRSLFGNISNGSDAITPIDVKII